MASEESLIDYAVYRTITEQKIVDFLLVEGFAYELQDGAEASRQALISAETALNAWVERGLGHGRSSSGARLFDPVEVIRFMITEHLEGRDTFWFDHWVLQGRRLVNDLVSSADFLDPNGSERRFEVDLQRTFVAPNRSPGGKVRLRAPLPIPKSDLHAVEIAPLNDVGPDARLTLAEGRLEARLAPPPGEDVTLSARLSFTARVQGERGPTPSALLSEDDRDRYLRRKEGFIAVTDQIIGLALTLAGTTASPAAAVTSFWNYILNTLRLAPMHYDQLDPLSPAAWSLEHGWCDCQLGCALLASLCRSIGVPARLVSGYFLYPLLTSRHYWAEVWTKERGWAAYDLFTWRLSAGGQDIVWRDYFKGRLDYRLTTERFPLTFTGAIGVAYPPLWQMLVSSANPGVDMSFVDIDGHLFYRDVLRIA